MGENFKGQLIALCLKLGLHYRFEEASTTGPSHDPRFVFQVFVNGEQLGEGVDKQKRTAANLASRMAFLAIRNRDLAHHEVQVAAPVAASLKDGFSQKDRHEAPPPVQIASPPTTPLVTNTSSTQSPSQVNGAANEIECDPNYVGKFNEYCQKNECTDYKFVDHRTGPQHIPEFFCSAWINDRKFPEAKGKNKKEAKKKAAQLALKVLKNEDPNNQELRQIPGLDDTDVEEKGNTSESGSVSNSSSNTPESQHSQSESSDSQIIFRSSDSGIPAAPKRPQSVSNSSSNTPESQHSQSESSDSQIIFRSSDSGIPAAPKRPQSVSNSSSNTPESQHSQSESSDSQIIFRSSDSGTPAAPKRPQRRTELAPNFQKCKPASNAVAEEKTFHSFLSEFTDITIIGKGAYGEVVKAKKKLDDKFYAVKKVRVTKKKYLQEVKALARLEHKNIVRYYSAWLEQSDFSDSSESSSCASDIGEKPETLFIQMELCENGTLEKWIKKRNNKRILNKPKSLEKFRQIVEGVEYIHEQQLIHRDLKPLNIFFTKEMIVKIGDFGLVTRMTGEDGKALQRTKAIGTTSYMAPEQEGEKYGNEVDIYALGLILFELLWIFGSVHEKAEKWKEIREGKLPERFAENHPIEDEDIKRILSKDYEKRPSAAALKNIFKPSKNSSARSV
ncbi:interferon-induced, double-stranded RNA-activated protein kinase-like isoform X2 [Pseudophryne corroboree]|uniref:interferon-induced, double-stranded RNA-activated protein kinase-like isoform X2 n=1 Tax=Pseudophryne corroboree TaxID=495146 RepID=UPI003081BB8A